MATLRLHRTGAHPIELDRERLLLGRDPACDVVLEDKSVSRRHVFLEQRGAGFYVIDQGSANGTFVDGAQVTEVELRDGQELRLGMYPMRVEIELDAPQTILMSAPSAAPGTVLMSSAAAAQFAAAAAPSPAARVPAVQAAPAAAAWEPAYAAPAPPRTPEEEAAAALGLSLGATQQQIRARFEELWGELSAKLSAAPTPHLQQTYQRNLDDLQRAYELLASGPPSQAGSASASVSEADLPAAQPSVAPDDMDMSIPAPVRAAIAGPAEAAGPAKSGVPALSTTLLSFAAMLVMSLYAFFALSRQKMEKELKQFEGRPEVQAARKDWNRFQEIDQIEKVGVLKNGAFKVCNKSSHAIEVEWMGALYVGELKADERGFPMRVFNSAFCAEEFRLTLAPNREETVKFNGKHDMCHVDGQGLFFAMTLKDPRNPDKRAHVSSTLHGRQECVAVGEGW